jgi:hypothetical protein
VPVQYHEFVFGSIDLYDKELETVIEIKEKVAKGPWQVRPFSSHVEQVRDLMAMKNVSKGALVYILVNSKEPIKQFNYCMTEEDLQAQLENLNEKANSFLNAKNSKNPCQVCILRQKSKLALP